MQAGVWLVVGFWGRLAPAGVVVGGSGVVLGLGSVVGVRFVLAVSRGFTGFDWSRS